MNTLNEDPRFDMSSLFDPRRAGLLVVDIQEKLWPHIDGNEETLRRALQAIHVAGHLAIPIFVTEQYVKGLGPTIGPVKDALARFDAYRPMEKSAFSCFGSAEFEEAFEKSGLDSLAVIGIESHVCVMQTTLDALDRNLCPFYIAEATGSRESAHKAEAIARVRDAGAIIGSVEMFAFEMMRTSKHPAFKKVQKQIV